MKMELDRSENAGDGLDLADLKDQIRSRCRETQTQFVQLRRAGAFIVRTQVKHSPLASVRPKTSITPPTSIAAVAAQDSGRFRTT
jgi:hypothetical protein